LHPHDRQTATRPTRLVGDRTRNAWRGLPAPRPAVTPDLPPTAAKPASCTAPRGQSGPGPTSAAGAFGRSLRWHVRAAGIPPLGVVGPMRAPLHRPQSAHLRSRPRACQTRPDPFTSTRRYWPWRYCRGRGLPSVREWTPCASAGTRPRPDRLPRQGVRLTAQLGPLLLQHSRRPHDGPQRPTRDARETTTRIPAAWRCGATIRCAPAAAALAGRRWREPVAMPVIHRLAHRCEIFWNGPKVQFP